MAGCRKGRRKARALWQAGGEPEGFSNYLVVKVKLLICKYTQAVLNVSPWAGRVEKVVAHQGIPALISCLVTLPKALVVLLSHSGAAGSEQRGVCVAHSYKELENFLVEMHKEQPETSARYTLPLLCGCSGAPGVSLRACLSSHELPRTCFNSHVTTVSTYIYDG